MCFGALHPFTEYFLMKYNCHSLHKCIHSLIQQTSMPSVPKALCQIYQTQRIKNSNYSFIILLFIKAVLDVHSLARGNTICSLEISENQHISLIVPYCRILHFLLFEKDKNLSFVQVQVIILKKKTKKTKLSYTYRVK